MLCELIPNGMFTQAMEHPEQLDPVHKFIQQLFPQNCPMDYYNIDRILAEEEKLKVKLPHNIETFGFYINPSLSAIRKDTKAELPLFLVKFLIQNGFCTLAENPLDLVRDDLEAQASLVDLRNRHFFLVNRLLSEPSKLAEFFYERIGSFTSLLLKDGFTEDDVARMSYEEKKLITNSRKSFKEFQDFLQGSDSTL
jgi:GINS complex subunit 3